MPGMKPVRTARLRLLHSKVLARLWAVRSAPGRSAWMAVAQVGGTEGAAEKSVRLPALR